MKPTQVNHPSLEEKYRAEIVATAFGDDPYGNGIDGLTVVGDDFVFPESRERRLSRHKILTSKAWRKLKQAHRHECLYCGKRARELTLDHIHPVALYGSDDIDNLAPACKPCNSSKSASTLEDWCARCGVSRGQIRRRWSEARPGVKLIL